MKWFAFFPLVALFGGLLSGMVQARAGSLPSAEDLPEHLELPDPLVRLSGKRVETRKEWERERRPELKELFQYYMYGSLPPAPRDISWKLVRVDRHYFGGKATKKEIDISFPPEGSKPIHVLLVIPNHRTRPSPVFVGINFCGNHSLVNDPSVPLPEGWIYSNCPACGNNHATEESRGGQINVWALEQSIDRGYAVATFYNGDIDPDTPDIADGIRPLFFKPGQSTPGPHDLGTVAAWAWGAQRVVDYVFKDKDLDHKRIAVVGHSRLGKAALVAAAFDERIALAIPHQAGCGGTAPSRGTVGESVKQINDKFPHWFNDQFKEFNGRPERLPFDQNGLVALMAPRPVLFSNATEDQWANPNGQFEVLKAADPVYRFLGVEGLSTITPPPVGQLVDSRLGYYIRPGKHSMTREDWKVFLDFADRHFGKRQ